jgi:uncharacterized cupredoxin-like copper-binding protein
MGRFVLFASALATVGVLAAVFALIAVQTGETSSASSSPSSPADTTPGATIGEISISAFDLGFEPATVDVAAAGTYSVMFHNTGGIAHDLTFADGTTIAAEAGQMATGTVTIPAGGTTFLCSIPGHSAAGMTGAVTVAGAAASPGGDSHGGPAPTTNVAADP